VQAALKARRAWLAEQGLIVQPDAADRLPRTILQSLQNREIESVAVSLAQEIGAPFSAVEDHGSVTGVYRREVGLISGRFALVERAHDFTLLPWRPGMERARGRSITAQIKGERVSWTFANAGKGIGRDEF